MNLNQIIKSLNYDEIINPINDLEINNVTKPEDADDKSIIFLFRNLKDELRTKAKVIVVKERIDQYEHCQIIHQNPRLAMAQVIETLFPLRKKTTTQFIHDLSSIGMNLSISNSVVINAFCSIGDNVSIGEGTVIHSNSTIGNNCSIGKNCIIYPNVTIYDHATIGDNSIFHSSVVIGADGFGYENNNGKWEKINHIGSVEIGDDVEIGANSCVDRAALGKTIIKNGVKIDNLVQIGHNCEINDDTIIVSGSLVGGSVKIGSNCIIAGDVSISDGVIIENNTTVLAKSGVTKNQNAGQTISGYPAINHRDETKFQAKLRRFLKSNN